LKQLGGDDETMRALGLDEYAFDAGERTPADTNALTDGQVRMGLQTGAELDAAADSFHLAFTDGLRAGADGHDVLNLRSGDDWQQFLV
jgi:hypothetical protein